jgi:hypothetical protein
MPSSQKTFSSPDVGVFGTSLVLVLVLQAVKSKT